MIKHFYVRIVHQTIPWSLSRRRLPQRRNGLSRPEKTSGLCRFPSPRSKHRPWVPKGRKEPKSTGFHERLKNCLKDFIILPSLLRMWRWAGWQLGWMQLIWLVGCQNLVERCTSRRSVPVPKLDRLLPYMLHTTPQIHFHPRVKLKNKENPVKASWSQCIMQCIMQYIRTSLPKIGKRLQKLENCRENAFSDDIRIETTYS